MSGIKIQINSLEALERLIGGNSEIEIELRNTIVQDFTKKHLKALATEKIMLEHTRALEKEIKKEFFNKIQEGSYSSITVFKEPYKTLVSKIVKSMIESEMTTLISSLIEEEKTKAVLKEALDKAIENITLNLESKVLESNIDRLVYQRLQEKFKVK